MLRPLHDKVLATDMEFGEQKLASGLVLLSDDGKNEGIHPRWCRVYAVGPEHKEDYGVGDWILVEHGRWSRGIDYEESENKKITIRLIDTNCVIMWNPEKPDTTVIGDLTSVTQEQTIRPEDFLS